MGISVVSIRPVLPSADMTVLLWTARRWNANYGSSFATRSLCKRSPTQFPLLYPKCDACSAGDLLDWNMVTPKKNTWEALQTLRKLYPVCKQSWLHLWCDSWLLNLRTTQCPLQWHLYALDHLVKSFLSCSHFKFHRKERGKLLLISCSVLFWLVLFSFVFFPLTAPDSDSPPHKQKDP